MAILKEATFELGSLTGDSGYGGTAGNASLETVNPILGSYSARHAPPGFGQVGYGAFTPASDGGSLAFHMRIDDPINGGSVRVCGAAFGPGSDVEVRIIHRVNSNGGLHLNIEGTYAGTETPELVAGVVYRIEFTWIRSTGSDGYYRFAMAEGDGEATVYAEASNHTFTNSLHEFRTGHLTGASVASGINKPYLFDNIYLSDDTTVPTIPKLEPADETEITATTLLQPVATLTIQQPTRITASTLIEPVASLAIVTPTRIAATTLIQPVASLTISADVITRIAATTLIQPVSSLIIAQHHLIQASTLLSLVAKINLAADDATRVRPVALIQPVATLAIEQRHHITAAALITPVSSLAIAQHHHISAVTLLRLVAYDNYTGPGTGIHSPGAPFSVNSLREGDTFTVYLPWAGLQGMSGLAHVMSRTARDDRRDQDVELAIVPHESANLPQLAGGARPQPAADSTDVARRLARTEREQDRIERER